MKLTQNELEFLSAWAREEWLRQSSLPVMPASI